MGNCISAESKTLPQKHSQKEGGFVVIVHVLSARNVKKTDLLSESDAFIRVRIGDKEKRTFAFSNSKKPVWNKVFKFAGYAEKPEKVEFVAMDKDKLSDEYIGHYTVSLANYWGKQAHDWEWVQLTAKSKSGEEEPVGELQIKIVAAEVTSQLKEATAHYDYTHLVHFTLVEGKDFRKMDYVGQNNSYAKVSWAEREFRSHTVNGNHPVWKQDILFWAAVETQRNYNIKVALYDEDVNKDDDIGVCYIPVDQLFEEDHKGLDRWFNIRPGKLITDRDLADLAKFNEDHTNVTGHIHVQVRIVPRDAVEKDFYSKLLKEFDTDGDGVLSKEEVAALIAALGVEMTDDIFEQFWNAVDLDQSGEVSEAEALLMVRMLMFMSGETANRVLHFLTFGIDALSQEFMKGVPRSHSTSEISIMSRESGIIVKENIPTYIKVAMKATYNSKAGRLFMSTKRGKALLAKMTIKQGKLFDDPSSASQIPDFVKLHNLNTDEMDRPLDEFKTFNEFFYRALKPSARPIDAPDDPFVAVVPADCRMMVFADIQDATKFWIKGDEFTLENLLGPLKELAPLYQSGAMAIARLAPQDYHRWHIPVNGKLGRRMPIAGAYFTVSPFAVNANVNVYTQNKREILELDSKEFGKVLLVAVGATMVGSINIITPNNAEVKKGDTHGYFAFGGSTVIVLFENNRIEFDKDLLANSNKKIETLVRVNTSLGHGFKK